MELLGFNQRFAYTRRILYAKQQTRTEKVIFPQYFRLLAKSWQVKYTLFLVNPGSDPKMPKARVTKKKKPQQRIIPMVWDFPEDLWSGYATNILVQTGDEELYVSFFEARPPVILNKADWEKVESVTAECIARVIITPDRLAKFIDALQQQLTAFNKKKAAKKSNGTK